MIDEADGLVVEDGGDLEVSAEGVHDVEWQFLGDAVNLRDTVDRVSVYVADRSTGLRAQITERHNALVADEAALGFDPIGSDADRP